MQKGIKKEMKKLIFSQIPTSQMETFIFPLDKDECLKRGIVFIEDWEFRYKGMMYDIVKSERVGDKIKYYCVNDKNEERLIDTFAKNNNKKKPFDFPSFNLLSSIFVSSGTINEVKCFAVTENIFYYDSDSGTLQGEKNPPEHPPKIIS
jgi:hypothetical protein